MEKSNKIIEKMRVRAESRKRKHKILAVLCNIGMVFSLCWIVSSIVAKYTH